MALFYTLSVVAFITTTASELPSWHMKPIGYHVKPDSVAETFASSMITPEDFASNFVLPRKPIIFRDVVKEWPAFKLWTDEYLKSKHGDMELRLEAKKEKGRITPKGDVCLGRDTLKTFLNDYKNGVDKYVVSELPTPMWRDVHIPPPMGCGDFVRNFVEIDVWINSDMGKKGKGGNSILHKDAFNTVNCVVNGSKEWKLFELEHNDLIYQSWEGPSEAGFGGFSLVNPDKVDATEFPDFGKIPRWQLASIKAGDCLYLPSQMWHQVKSSGESNKAVAFLFSRFEDHAKLNLSTCPKVLPIVSLADVDVDLQYPGTGLMTMGDNEIEQTAKDLLDLVNEEKGFITKRNVLRMVYRGQSGGLKVRNTTLETIKKYSRELYNYLLSIAEGDANEMTPAFVSNLKRAQIRPMYKWLFKEDPSNGCNLEYSLLAPDDIIVRMTELRNANDGALEKSKFIRMYEEAGGTLPFAETLWEKLAGAADVVTEISKETMKKAFHLYEEYQREEDDDDADGETTITTPQGHVSQPKKRGGTFNKKYEDDDNDVGDADNDEDDNRSEEGRDSTESEEEEDEEESEKKLMNDDNVVREELKEEL